MYRNLLLQGEKVGLEERLGLSIWQIRINLSFGIYRARSHAVTLMASV